jgi:hypothetical protein
MLFTLTTAACERPGNGSNSAAARSTFVRCSTRARRHRVRVRSTITSDGSRPITIPLDARRAVATTPTPGPQPIITTLASGLGFTKSTAAFSMSALPVAITVAMIRPPQPSHGNMRFKMSTPKWCHTRVPKNGVSRSKHLLKPQPLPHHHWGLELRTSLTKAGDGAKCGAKFADTPCVIYIEVTGVRPESKDTGLRFECGIRCSYPVTWTTQFRL